MPNPKHAPATDPGADLEAGPPIERLEAIEIRPGDLIAIHPRTGANTTPADAFRIAERIQETFHDNPVVVLTGDAHIDIYRAAAVDPAQIAGDYLRLNGWTFHGPAPSGNLAWPENEHGPVYGACMATYTLGDGAVGHHCCRPPGHTDPDHRCPCGDGWPAHNDQETPA